MLSHEWPLVFFTLLAQLSAGLMIALLPFVFIKEWYKQMRNSLFLRTSLYISLISMAIALAISFLHLNQPLNAIYALSNIKTSWLSREILMASLFIFLIALSIVLFVRKKANDNQLKLAILVSSIAGVILIYVMARLYMIPTVPPWDNTATITGFFSSALLLGPALVFALYLRYNHVHSLYGGGQPLHIIILLIIIALTVKLIEALFISVDVPYENIAFAPQQIPEFLPLLQRLSLLVGAISVLTWSFLSSRYKMINYLIYFSLICFFASEFMERTMFYASYFRIGM